MSFASFQVPLIELDEALIDAVDAEVVAANQDPDRIADQMDPRAVSVPRLVLQASEQASGVNPSLAWFPTHCGPDEPCLTRWPPTRQPPFRSLGDCSTSGLFKHSQQMRFSVRGQEHPVRRWECRLHAVCPPGLV